MAYVLLLIFLFLQFPSFFVTFIGQSHHYETQTVFIACRHGNSLTAAFGFSENRKAFSRYGLLKNTRKEIS